MGVESIVDRIISDANTEAENIISQAERRAGEIIAAANTRADRRRQGTDAEVSAKAKSVIDGKDAAARLDGAKAELKEKRRVIDAVYAKALEKLCALDMKNAVELAERLLSEYAEEGDEIVFAGNYKFVREVSALDIVGEKKLAVSRKSADIGGGFVLKGKVSDKDISYGALLLADREKNQTELAAKIFIKG